MKKLIFLMVLFLCAEVHAANLYVDPSTGDDSNTYAQVSAGTHKWASIGRAAWGSTDRSSPSASQAAQAGDTVYIAAGTYTTIGTPGRWSVAYNPINSGTSEENRITFSAVGTVILQYSSGSGPMIGSSNLDVPGGSHARNYITWDGFTIYEADAPSATDSGVVMIVGASNVIIENMWIDGDVDSPLFNNHGGIWIQGSDVIATNNVKNIIVRNNYIQNVLNAGSFSHNAGGVMSYYTEDVTIENNEMYNCGAGITLKGGYNERWTIRENYIRSGGKGIAVLGQWDYEVGNGRIYQNIIANNTMGGLHFNGPVTVRRFIIANNTFYNNDGGLVVSWPESTLINNNFQNNIVHTGVMVNMGTCEAGLCSPMTLDRNNYYRSGGFLSSLEGQDYSSLGAWNTVLGGCPNDGNDCSSITSDPLFVNASISDFKLQEESPALTLGRTITDIHGSSGETIPAGAYITGSEVIGIDSNGGTPSISAPSGLKVVGGFSWQ